MAKREFTKWTDRGNIQFQKALVDGLHPEYRKELLEKAYHCYSRSHDVADDPLDAVSATNKCILAKQNIHHGCEIGDLQIQASVLKDLLYYSQIIFEEGKKANLGGPFYDNIKGDFDKYVTESFKLFRRMDTKQAAWWIEEFVMIIHVLPVRCSLYKEMVSMLYARSGHDIEERQYGSAITFLQDCKLALQKVSQLPPISREFVEWTQQMELLMKSRLCLAKALFTMEKADELLNELKKTFKAESDMDVLYEIIDTYTKVIQMTENKENEVAAEAYNRLGKVFDEMIKDDERSRMYFRKSMALAQQNWPTEATNQTASQNKDPVRSSLYQGTPRNELQKTYAEIIQTQNPKMPETRQQDTLTKRPVGRYGDTTKSSDHVLTEERTCPAGVHYPTVDQRSKMMNRMKTRKEGTRHNLDDILEDLKIKSKEYRTDNKKFLDFLWQYYPPRDTTTTLQRWFCDDDSKLETDDQIIKSIDQAIQDYDASLRRRQLPPICISVYANILEDLRKRETVQLVKRDKRREESDKKALEHAIETMKQMKFEYKRHKSMLKYIVELLETFPPKNQRKKFEVNMSDLTEEYEMKHLADKICQNDCYNPDEQDDQSNTWLWVCSKIQKILYDWVAEDKQYRSHTRKRNDTSCTSRRLPSLRKETKF